MAPSHIINPKVADTSHWDPVTDAAAMKAAGYVGLIIKATQGSSITDPTYVKQQHAAKAAGLLVGSYHFADSSDINAQVQNYLNFASPDPDELFCLDWEDNNGNKMTATQAQAWITAVEAKLNRPNQCVLYSGNTAKELIQGKDSFFGARRLWLAQYTTNPSVQQSWDTYFLWQFTDGTSGPQPHTVDGVGHCDISSYAGTGASLASTWATGSAVIITPPAPIASNTVNIVVDVPPGVIVKITQNQG